MVCVSFWKSWETTCLFLSFSAWIFRGKLRCGRKIRQYSYLMQILVIVKVLSFGRMGFPLALFFGQQKNTKNSIGSGSGSNNKKESCTFVCVSVSVQFDIMMYTVRAQWSERKANKHISPSSVSFLPPLIHTAHKKRLSNWRRVKLIWILSRPLKAFSPLCIHSHPVPVCMYKVQHTSVSALLCLSLSLAFAPSIVHSLRVFRSLSRNNVVNF